MAIGRAAKELTEELLKAKRVPRKEFKTLSEVPEDIKQLPTEERITKADEFLAEDKASQFAEVRQEDIALDTGATYAEQAKQQAKIDAQIAKQEELEAKATETPFPDRETFLREERAKAQLGANEEKLQQLQERQRDLYLKANNLKLEKEAVAIMESEKKAGVSYFDTLLNTVASTPGAGRKFANIESRTDAIYNRVNAGMFELKESLRTKWLGMSQDIEMANDVIRYLKDGQVKNKDNVALDKSNI